jgi:hypothetical protein
METKDIKNTDNIDHSKEKGNGNGFLGYLLMFAGFIIFLVILSKVLMWLLK